MISVGNMHRIPALALSLALVACSGAVPDAVDAAVVVPVPVDAAVLVDAELAARACTETRWYRDDDGDGFGAFDASGYDAGAVQYACAQPAGFVAEVGDCDDADARAHPGQTETFATPRPSGSFDFDCNGI